MRHNRQSSVNHAPQWPVYDSQSTCFQSLSGWPYSGWITETKIMFPSQTALGQIEQSLQALAVKQHAAAFESSLLAYAWNYEGYGAQQLACTMSDSSSRSFQYSTASDAFSSAFRDTQKRIEAMSLAALIEQQIMTIRQAQLGVDLFCCDDEFTGFFEQNMFHFNWTAHPAPFVHKRIDCINSLHFKGIIIIYALFRLDQWLDFDDDTFNLLIHGIKEEGFENNSLLDAKFQRLFWSRVDFALYITQLQSRN